MGYPKQEALPTGSGSLHKRTLVILPTPQSAEHWVNSDHFDQPPSTKIQKYQISTEDIMLINMCQNSFTI